MADRHPLTVRTAAPWYTFLIRWYGEILAIQFAQVGQEGFRNLNQVGEGGASSSTLDGSYEVARQTHLVQLIQVGEVLPILDLELHRCLMNLLHK